MQLPGQSVLGRAGEQLGLPLLHQDVDQVVVVQAHGSTVRRMIGPDIRAGHGTDGSVLSTDIPVPRAPRRLSPPRHAYFEYLPTVAGRLLRATDESGTSS